MRWVVVGAELGDEETGVPLEILPLTMEVSALLVFVDVVVDITAAAVVVVDISVVYSLMA